MIMSARKGQLRFSVVQLLVDFICVTVCVSGAFLLIRAIGGATSPILSLIGAAALIAALQATAHLALGGYRSSWRFFSTPDALRCATSVMAGAAVGIVLFLNAIPASGWILIAAGALSGAVAPRLAVRIATNSSLRKNRHALRALRRGSYEDDNRRKLILIGYGDNASSFIRTHHVTDTDYCVVGLVHIQKECEAASLRGVPVLGPIEHMASIVETLTAEGRRPDTLVLTRDELAHRSVGEVLSLTDKTGLPVAWLPRADHIDESSGQHLRPINLDDLLPRQATQFDASACADIMGEATVLVTGAGGSIGSELVRQIAGLARGGHLILTDVSEHALYLIDQEVRREFHDVGHTSLLLDVRDRSAVERAMRRFRPDYVFHAAALKHVPIVEAQACEGVVTNVLGSRNVADAAAENDVRAMVLISTDKAVNPANVMGATKRLAEAYCQAMDAALPSTKGRTRFLTTRFGNVLGSNGSVVPLFQQQLAQGGPLTVTHPDVERFFMTIPEASRLILQALLLALEDTDGEQGIFVLDMGMPVKIADLARQVIRLSGLKPDVDVKITYTGLRPGEKLYEELMHETEHLLPTGHPSLMIATPRFVQIQTVRSQIEVLKTAAEAGNVSEVIRLLKLYVPEFELTSKHAKSAYEAGVEEPVIQESRTN